MEHLSKPDSYRCLVEFKRFSNKLTFEIAQ